MATPVGMSLPPTPPTPQSSGAKKPPASGIQEFQIVMLAKKALNNRKNDKFVDDDLNTLIGKVLQLNIKMPALKTLLSKSCNPADVKSLMDAIEPSVRQIQSHQKEQISLMVAGIIAGIAIMVLGIIATATGFGAFVGIPLIIVGGAATLFVARPIVIPIAKVAFSGIRALFTKATYKNLWKKLKPKKKLKSKSSLPTPIRANSPAKASTKPVPQQAGTPGKTTPVPQPAASPPKKQPTPPPSPLATPAPNPSNP